MTSLTPHNGGSSLNGDGYWEERALRAEYRLTELRRRHQTARRTKIMLWLLFTAVVILGFVFGPTFAQLTTMQ